MGGEIMRALAFAVFAALVLGTAGGLSAAVLHVPGEYPTIQAGIDAALDGDTVLVADGTYAGEGNRDIDFAGRAILLTSENGPDATIIDCEEAGRGFYFHLWEDSSAVLRGFTITNGFAMEEGGGAICCYESFPTITGNRMVGNGAFWAQGGAISCISAAPTIANNTIANNGGYWGGGIACSEASPTIVDNVITGNGAWWGGGIFCNESSAPLILGNLIADNCGGYYGDGSGIGCYQSWPTIMHNTIVDNWTHEVAYGGGIGCYESHPAIVGNIIAGNKATEGGGGVSCRESSSALLVDNTICRNEAPDGLGGGLFCSESSPVVINAILWGNTAYSGLEIHADVGSSPEITYSDIRGGWSGQGNIDARPEFVLPAAHDYRLLWGSPCVDAGLPGALDPDSTRSDMGAHFFDQSKALVTYATPESRTLCRGDICRVLYTLVNCHPDSVAARGIVELTLPGGEPWPYNPLEGPGYGVMPPEFNWQYVREYRVPEVWPIGTSAFTWRVGFAGTLYDQDSFAFTVVEEE
jgi:hypothetical protein